MILSQIDNSILKIQISEKYRRGRKLDLVGEWMADKLLLLLIQIILFFMRAFYLLKFASDI